MTLAQLYIWHDRFWFSAPSVKSGMSCRHAVVILYSLAGRPIQVDTDKGEHVDAPAMLIASNVTRRLDANDVELLSLHVDHMSFEYHALVRMLDNRALMALDWAVFKPFVPMLRRFYQGNLEYGEAYRLFNEFVRAITDYRPSNILIDMRVLHVASRVMTELPLTHTVEELAANVGISPDRLTHLFSEQLGVSLKSYILWAKMRRAALLFPEGGSLTDIAHRVGFADSAHLTRTFKAYFGLTPSYLANPDLVRVRGY